MTRGCGLATLFLFQPLPSLHGQGYKSSDYGHRLRGAVDNYLLTLTDEASCHCVGHCHRHCPNINCEANLLAIKTMVNCTATVGCSSNDRSAKLLVPSCAVR